MTITDYSTVRLGQVTEITVTSDLSGTIYYHWYFDGSLWASTESPTYSILLGVGEMIRLEVLDTNDPDFDPIANAPDGYPARRGLWWVRSLASDIDEYRVEQQKDGGGWETITVVPHLAREWEYSAITDRLEDLADYEFRVVPIDRAGNDGTPISLSAETVVRTPDAPDWEYSFDEGTAKVTFSEAA